MRGFTLIELLVVLAIFLVLLAIVIPMGVGLYQIELLNQTQTQLVWLLREARDNAVNQKNNSYFGVKVLQEKLVLYRGDNYENRIVEEDEAYNYPNIITMNGIDEVIFTPTTGFTNTQGSIFLKTSSASREIKINQLGIIDY